MPPKGEKKSVKGQKKKHILSRKNGILFGRCQKITNDLLSHLDKFIHNDLISNCPFATKINLNRGDQS